ncbi:hypothetical protein [Paenarthrobacter nitroguajacolicus]|uniref:hypothetical protein n=1 Tax=Paenarthrobacter nitroguajacolicus TaxID=211146 RepID=UPI00248B22BC|nr:hypothetical protein [Paenarthrobacter nitroguajacolicus]MDI2036439.1 hypothetical protein [Paenarthrobacter nitroguajacolicus]
MHATPARLALRRQDAASWLAPDPDGQVFIEDMEYRSELSVLRHYVENRLAAFALAVSTNDPAALTSLLQSVRVDLVEAKRRTEPVDAQDIIHCLSPWNRPALLTTCNLTVQSSGDAARYTATYQLWPMAARSTEMVSFGVFRGTFNRGHQVWRWSEHTVQPSGAKD